MKTGELSIKHTFNNAEALSRFLVFFNIKTWEFSYWEQASIIIQCAPFYTLTAFMSDFGWNKRPETTSLYRKWLDEEALKNEQTSNEWLREWGTGENQDRQGHIWDNTRIHGENGQISMQFWWYIALVIRNSYALHAVEDLEVYGGECMVVQWSRDTLSDGIYIAISAAFLHSIQPPSIISGRKLVNWCSSRCATRYHGDDNTR